MASTSSSAPAEAATPLIWTELGLTLEVSQAVEIVGGKIGVKFHRIDLRYCSYSFPSRWFLIITNS